DSSGVMISLRVKSLPSSSGQNAGGMVPLGLNMMSNLCLGRAGLARPRLGRPIKKGSAPAEMPTCLRNCRRAMAFIVLQVVWSITQKLGIVYAKFFKRCWGTRVRCGGENSDEG